MTPASSLPAGYFEALYAGDADPWRFATSDYERAKYAATLAALPRPHYARALEVGCSIGVLTAALAPRCAGLPQVAFARMAVPGEWPEDRFDLILLSEVLYYLDAADLARLAARVAAALLPGGDVLLVHWIGATDYPLSGDAAAEGFIAALAPAATVRHQARAERYRFDLLRRID